MWLLLNSLGYDSLHYRYFIYPPMEEIIIGKIKSCSREGVHVNSEFFDDILIPAESLQHPSRFDETDSVWVWEYPTGDDTTPHNLYMDPGEMIRFRVVSKLFVNTGPTKPKGGEAEQKEEVKTLIGTIKEPELGLLTWWKS